MQCSLVRSSLPNPLSLFVFLLSPYAAGARIGAPHSVVFAGFSSHALSSRIQDASCKVVITADEGRRGGRCVPLKVAVDEALLSCPSVTKVFVKKNTQCEGIVMKEGRDVYLDDALSAERPYCPPEWMDSEDILFLLYTSGSTGTPKGVVHTQAGYLLYAMMTHKYVFDVRPGDVYACVADVGWITYAVYSSLHSLSHLTPQWSFVHHLRPPGEWCEYPPL